MINDAGQHIQYLDGRDCDHKKDIMIKGETYICYCKDCGKIFDVYKNEGTITATEDIAGLSGGVKFNLN